MTSRLFVAPMCTMCRTVCRPSCCTNSSQGCPLAAWCSSIPAAPRSTLLKRTLGVTQMSQSSGCSRSSIRNVPSWAEACAVTTTPVSMHVLLYAIL